MIKFSRSKWVGIERPAKDTFCAHGILEDNIYGLELDVEVKVPEFRITRIEGKARRITTPECPKAVPVLQNAIGLCITAPDFPSQANRKVGREGCRHFANLLLECCDTIVRSALYEEWEELKKRGTATDKEAYFKERVQSIPNMANSCYAS